MLGWILLKLGHPSPWTYVAAKHPPAVLSATKATVLGFISKELY